MRIQKLSYYKKNKKRIKLNKLYSELVKTKHLLKFFLASLKTKQLLSLYKVISKKKFFVNFLKKLEFRLDFLLVKSNLSLSGKQVKQLISHSHILVNGNIITIPSYEVKKFDLISFNKDHIISFKKGLINNLFKTTAFFSYLRRTKKIIKKVSLNHLLLHSKFPAHLEVNYRTFTLLNFRDSHINEYFLPRVVSVYDYSQLHFVL